MNCSKYIFGMLMQVQYMNRSACATQQSVLYMYVLCVRGARSHIKMRVAYLAGVLAQQGGK